MDANATPTDEWIDLSRRRCRREATATVQGELLTYKVLDPSPRKGGGQRGVIRDFSPASRLRMLKAFHTIDWNETYRPIFITLTYPDDLCMTDKDNRAVHRSVMARHLERITGRSVPAAWRVEWEVRKSGKWKWWPVAHHHWLVFGHRFIDCREVNRLWKETIGHDGYCRTETKRLDKRKAAQLYLAKYISKNACACSLVIGAYHNSVGRQYGWLRREEVPKHNSVEFAKIDADTRRKITRLAEEQLPWLPSGTDQSFTLMGQAAVDAGRILHGECLDS